MEFIDHTIWGTTALDESLSFVARLIPVLVLFEFVLIFIWRRHRTHWKDFVNNVSNGLVHRVINLLVWTPLYFFLHESLRSFALLDWEPTSLLDWGLVLLATDFIYYWFHRLLHRVPLLWTLHDSHHSAPYLHWLSAFRLNWMLGGFRALSHIPLTLLGVPPSVTYFCYILVLVYQIFIHSEYIRTPKFFDSLLNTPDLHRIHHSQNQVHYDRNFGGVLILWDRLFGTYHERTKASLNFGVREHDGMGNIFDLNFGPLLRLIRRCRRSSSKQAVWSGLFFSPMWTEGTVDTKASAGQ